MGLAAAIAFGSISVGRIAPSPDDAAYAAVPMVEERFLLRCLQPGEAAELILPLLGRSSSVLVPGHAPRVLVVRAMQSQLREVRSLLGRYESAGSMACPMRPTPAPAR